MHIFFASDNKFVLPLINALSSILRYSNKDDFYHFYILDKNISSKNKSRINKLKKIKDFDIEYIKVDNSLFLDCPLTKECKHVSLQTYYRYKIINAACEEAGLEERVGTHTLRKTFGYHHYQKFKDVVMLQKIFNHYSPEITLRYIGIEQAQIDESYTNFIL